MSTTTSTLDAETVQKTSTLSTLWKGSKKLIEQPNSPAWTVGSPAQCQRIFVGPYDVAMKNWPLSGMTMRDMPDGWTIEDGATIVRAKGGKGVVTIPLISYTYAQSDFGEDSDENQQYSFERKPVDKAIEMHPGFYLKVSDTFLEAIDAAINSKGAKRDAEKAKFKDNELAMRLYRYRLQGTDGYRYWQPIVTRRWYTPRLGRALPTAPPSAKWEQPPYGPAANYYKTDGKIEWVYKGRKVIGWWTIEEWTGFDVKDTFLYPV